MPTARRVHHAYEDYLRVEEESVIKHEYWDGEIYAMPGGTPEHGALASRMTVVLGAALSEPCRPLSSDVKIRIAATDLTTYPDLSVVCGSLERSPEDRHAIVNPIVVVEVTSPSTEDYDRGDKLSHYRQIASLQAVVLVSLREPRVTVVGRDAAGWSSREFRAGETVELAKPELSFAVDDVYSVLDGL